MRKLCLKHIRCNFSIPPIQSQSQNVGSLGTVFRASQNNCRLIHTRPSSLILSKIAWWYCFSFQRRWQHTWDHLWRSSLKSQNRNVKESCEVQFKLCFQNAGSSICASFWWWAWLSTFWVDWKIHLALSRLGYKNCNCWRFRIYTWFDS